ncbi:MAG: Fic family protein [Candidatus Magnetominusculus sp. LBB02]|nr:Fic family protein [Candidatus Magnetominusculus sp. LBB02]
MPHKAGSFVLAYQWDNHCQAIFDSLMGKFGHMLRELGELEHQEAPDAQHLLYYYMKWHYNRELYVQTMLEIEKKCDVINSLGYRGYGVNIDLLNAIGALDKDYRGYILRLLAERFNKYLWKLKEIIMISDEDAALMSSSYIIAQLCELLGRDAAENTPVVTEPIVLDLTSYFKIMGEETAWNVNTAIFQKLFLHLGCASNTIMKGSVGHEDQLTPQELKIIGNRNFIEMYKESFSTLHTYTEIGLELLKNIHLTMSKNTVPNAGSFRPFDFPDKNGVTFDNGNFDREINDLQHVLWETSQSFHNLDAFIYDLARSYYMFIAIHPFWDSNGRVGKCFLNYMLLKKGIPPISFSQDEEVRALPRYGGSIEDMHDYIRNRINVAVEAYFYERWKIEHLGFLEKQIYNVSFDSGFYFRQIDDRPQRLEVHFIAYIVDGGDPLFATLHDRCRVVFPVEHHLYNMTIYCGFSKKERGDWEHVFNIKHHFFIKEIQSDILGAKAFDIDFSIELYDYHYGCAYFNCCVVSHEGGHIHNNKGLNFSYKIQR